MDKLLLVYVKVSIHAPLAERDPVMWGKTKRLVSFNPRAPCGARRLLLIINSHNFIVSIHAPLAERDHKPDVFADEGIFVSIHAPLAERDYAQVAEKRRYSSFNPRAPCGARPRYGETTAD